jgi:hypothetical protein
VGFKKKGVPHFFPAPVHKKWGFMDLNVLKFCELVINGSLDDKIGEREEGEEGKFSKKTVHFLEKISKSPRASRKDAKGVIKGILREEEEIMLFVRPTKSQPSASIAKRIPYVY